MFGYIKPYMPYIYQKDKVLYQALYCGLCKSIGKTCGQKARMTLSYDMTFLSAFLHNVKNVDVTLKKERCILHWIVPRPIAQNDDITSFVAAIHMILVYYKLIDDIEDENKGKFKRNFFLKGYKKAKKLYPEIDKIVAKYMHILKSLEKECCASIDRVADPFGMMLTEIGAFALQENFTESISQLFYYIGKWIYLVDALDDYDHDIAKKNYNPFFIAYKAKNKRELWTIYEKDINFIFQNIFISTSEMLQNITFYFNHDLTDNIILRGMPYQTQYVIDKKSKLEKKEYKFRLKEQKLKKLKE